MQWLQEFKGLKTAWKLKGNSHFSFDEKDIAQVEIAKVGNKYVTTDLGAQFEEYDYGYEHNIPILVEKSDWGNKDLLFCCLNDIVAYVNKYNCIHTILCNARNVEKALWGLDLSSLFELNQIFTPLYTPIEITRFTE